MPAPGLADVARRMLGLPLFGLGTTQVKQPNGKPRLGAPWWSTEVRLLSAAESARPNAVEYRYFCVPEPGQAPCWEEGPNRVIREWKRDPSAGPSTFKHDEWGRR